ncbi:uncharacterized protein TNCV_732651 [Trichonephila clavipes]|nr:uncharacterized protein TNCV_732651 [Trichonephila clavipes]
MLEKVIGNWTSGLDYIKASRDSHIPDIIFKIAPDSSFGTPEAEKCVFRRVVCNSTRHDQDVRIVRHNDDVVRNGGKEVKLFANALKDFQCNGRIFMAQRKHLDDFLRGRIIGRLECGHTQLEVTEELVIAQSVIFRLWQRFQDDGHVSRCCRTGRPRVTTPNEDWYIFGSYCQKKQTEHSIRLVSSALFSYRYNSFKADRVQMLREHWSICSQACQMCSTYRNSLSLTIKLE